MTTQITLTLADETYQRIERFAKMVGQPISEVLATTLESTIPQIEDERPISSLSDSEVLKLIQLQMNPQEDELHSELLYKQHAGLLTSDEKIELWRLTHLYEVLLLRKSQALAEAVQRGLRNPLEP